MAWAISSPVAASPWALTVAMCSMSARFSSGRDCARSDSTTAATARSMPRRICIGPCPAAIARRPRVTMACASTVAVVVPSPATSPVLSATSFTSCAPMFSKRSASSTSREIASPSLVMVGAPLPCSITTLRPRGPSVTRTTPASWSTPRRSASRASSSNWMRFPMAALRSRRLDEPGVLLGDGLHMRGRAGQRGRPNIEPPRHQRIPELLVADRRVQRVLEVFGRNVRQLDQLFCRAVPVPGAAQQQRQLAVVLLPVAIAGARSRYVLLPLRHLHPGSAAVESEEVVAARRLVRAPRAVVGIVAPRDRRVPVPDAKRRSVPGDPADVARDAREVEPRVWRDFGMPPQEIVAQRAEEEPGPELERLRRPVPRPRGGAQRTEQGQGQHQSSANCGPAAERKHDREPDAERAEQSVVAVPANGWHEDGDGTRYTPADCERGDAAARGRIEAHSGG